MTTKVGGYDVLAGLSTGVSTVFTNGAYSPISFAQVSLSSGGYTFGAAAFTVAATGKYKLTLQIDGAIAGTNVIVKKNGAAVWTTTFTIATGKSYELTTTLDLTAADSIAIGITPSSTITLATTAHSYSIERMY